MDLDLTETALREWVQRAEIEAGEVPPGALSQAEREELVWQRRVNLTLTFYGFPRFTGDLDLLVKPDVDNARSILDVLSEFGFSSLGLTEADFLQPEQVVQLGGLRFESI